MSSPTQNNNKKKRVAVWGYRPGSRSAKAIADALGVPVLRHTESKWRPDKGRSIINWGASQIPGQYSICDILNRPQLTQQFGNKLAAFEAWTHHSDPPRLPKWTTFRDQMSQWCADGKSAVGRSTLTGHSGAGITISENPLDIPVCPLYTIYMKKDSEWRIHCFRRANGEAEIIFEQKKIRDPDREPTSWQVRSHANGFIFQHTGLNVPEDVRAQALKAFRATGLDFGAVDAIYQRRPNRAIVLEINTAPGLEGETVKRYADAIATRLAG